MINRITLTILNLYLQANDDIKREIEYYISELASDREDPAEE